VSINKRVGRSGGTLSPHFELDASLRPNEMQALIGHQLCAAGEDRLATALELEDRGRHAISVHLRSRSMLATTRAGSLPQTRSALPGRE